MTIEGLGKKFQDARLARGLTLDEAARMTKIRPSRLAEIEADDFSEFPSLAYAKGFLLIYGKFLDVDVTPYMEAFETSDAVTVDGYSYLQEEPAQAPVRSTPVRRRPARSASPSAPSGGDRTSLMPLVIGVVVIVIGFLVMKLFLNLQRLAPRRVEPAAVAQASVTPAPTQAPVQTAPAKSIIASPTQAPVAAAAPAASVAPSAPPIAAAPPTIAPTPPPVAVATPTAKPAASEPEVRRAEPVRAEDLKAATTTTTTTVSQKESTGSTRVAIRPLKKTYIKVVVDDEAQRPAFERWISPADGPVEFRGEHIAVRVLDRDAVQIKKNGKALEDDGDDDVTVE